MLIAPSHTFFLTPDLFVQVNSPGCLTDLSLLAVGFPNSYMNKLC